MRFVEQIVYRKRLCEAKVLKNDAWLTGGLVFGK